MRIQNGVFIIIRNRSVENAKTTGELRIPAEKTVRFKLGLGHFADACSVNNADVIHIEQSAVGIKGDGD